MVVGLLEELVDVGHFGDVTLNRYSLAAHLLDRCNGFHGGFTGLGIVDDYAGSSLSKGLCHDGAETSAGTSDEGHFPIEADI